MKRIRNSLAGLLGITLVIGAIMFDTSRSSRAATTGTGKSDVVVVNDVDNPVISRLVGTTPVSISGTPTVGIDSANNIVRIDSGTPVHVSDAESARQPFKTSGALFSSCSSSCLVALANVPMGKRLVIEYVTASVVAANGEHVLLFVNTTAGGVGGLRPLPLKSQGTFGGDEQFIASENVKMFADPGTSIEAKILVDNSTIVQYVVTLDGYLVDVP